MYCIVLYCIVLYHHENVSMALVFYFPPERERNNLAMCAKQAFSGTSSLPSTPHSMGLSVQECHNRLEAVLSGALEFL